jgi:hypothetical protein
VWSIRLAGPARRPLGLALGGLCVFGGVTGFAVLDRSGPAAKSAVGSALPHYAIAGLTATRLNSTVGAEYGFRFMSAAEPADPGGVDMATARDSGGDQLRVIVFGRAPGPVQSVSCEITPSHVPHALSTPAIPSAASGGPTPAVAGFLADCARVGVGGDQAAAAVQWAARAQTGLAGLAANQTRQGRLTRATRFGAVGYAVRRVPDTGEWIMSMTAEPPAPGH